MISNYTTNYRVRREPDFAQFVSNRSKGVSNRAGGVNGKMELPIQG